MPPTTAPFTLLLALSLLRATASTTSAAAASVDAAKPRGRFSKIYAFGDSFTDTGNTRSATGPFAFGYVSNAPYGTSFFHRPTNRYCDGRLVVDFLASALSLPFVPPYLDSAADFSSGVNFAVAGSTALDHDFFVEHNITLDVTPQSLSTQLGWFEKYLAGKGCGGGRGSKQGYCGDLLEDALFWVGEIGVNDYAYTFGSSVTPETVRALAISNVTSFLQTLLDRGARYMVVQGLPATGCLPLTLTLAPPDDRDATGCSANSNRYTQIYNALLQSKLQGLRQQYPRAVISYADYYSAHRAIVTAPAAHGFAEPFRTCCGSGGGKYNFDVFSTCGSPGVSRACAEPRKFVNWDGVHLTEAVYEVVADMFFRRGYCHPPFPLLLGSEINN